MKNRFVAIGTPKVGDWVIRDNKCEIDIIPERLPQLFAEQIVELLNEKWE